MESYHDLQMQKMKQSQEFKQNMELDAYQGLDTSEPVKLAADPKSLREKLSDSDELSRKVDHITNGAHSLLKNLNADTAGISLSNPNR